MTGKRVLLCGELELLPRHLAREVPRHAALRDGHHYFCERTSEHKIPLARGALEPPEKP